MDDVACAAAGRPSNYSGCGFGERDLGWTDLSELEAHRIAKALRKIGLQAEVKRELTPEEADAAWRQMQNDMEQNRLLAGLQ